MSPEERRLRSRLRQILNRSGVLHGTLVRRRRVCGKPNCRCARGQKHESLYLVVTEGGKGRQLYVPAEWEDTVREWIANYNKTREFMEDLSAVHWEKVRTRRR